MNLSLNELQALTIPLTREGDPDSLREQFLFFFSRQRIGFYWEENSFTCFHKQKRGPFIIVKGKAVNENEGTRIKTQISLNKISVLANRVAWTLVILASVTGFIIKMQPLVFLPIMYLPVAATFGLINRHHRKEAIWYLQDLISGKGKLFGNSFWN